MRLKKLEISNYIGARSINIDFHKPIALISGRNASGKSSCLEAVRHAITGESTRVSLKKDFEHLVSEGAKSGFVEVTLDNSEVSVVLPKGDRHLAGDSIHGAIQYVLDAQRFARMDDKERRTFLFGLMGVKLDGASVSQRMTDKGLDAKKIAQIAPFLRAGFDAAQKEAAAKARDAKASWKTLTGGETWGKDKAVKWQPAALPADAEKAGIRRDNALAKMKEVEQELGAAQQELGAAKAQQHARQQWVAQRAELVEKAGRIDRIQMKLLRDEADAAEWAKKVETTREKAGGVPVNPKAPGEFLLRGLASVTADFLDLTCKYPDIEWDSGLLNRAAVHLSEYRKLHGDPSETGAPAQPDPEAVAKLPEYENALELLQRAVANDKRDLSAAEFAAAKIKEMDDSATAPIDIDPLQAKVAELTERRDNWRTDADKYRAIADQAARRQTVIDQAAAHHADVLAWSDIADALAPDGIPGELLAEALAPINDRLFASSGIAEWSQVVIHSDMRITFGLRDYALISESEKWRADAMIAEAVSFLAGAKLLVLDRFDVLDLKGREDLLFWLDGMAADGAIDTALVFGTLKALPAINLATIEAHWIENGSVAQFKEAA